MIDNILLEHLSEISVLTEFKHFLYNFSGITFKILNINGIDPGTPSSSKNTTDYKIPRYVLNECRSTKTVQAFFTGKAYNIIAPIKFSHQNIIGFIFIYETPSSNATKSSIMSIAEIIQTLVHDITENQLKLFSHIKSNKTTPQHAAIKKVINYISKNYNTPEISLTQVCRDCGISYFYLSHLLKKELNTTFTEYLTNVRLNVARNLLKDQRLTISQISYLCGFLDSGYFCKVFKRKYGYPPITLRKRNGASLKRPPDNRKFLPKKRNPVHC